MIDSLTQEEILKVQKVFPDCIWIDIHNHRYLGNQKELFHPNAILGFMVEYGELDHLICYKWKNNYIRKFTYFNSAKRTSGRHYAGNIDAIIKRFKIIVDNYKG